MFEKVVGCALSCRETRSVGYRGLTASLATTFRGFFIKNCLFDATSSVTAHVVRVTGFDRPTTHNANSGRVNQFLFFDPLRRGSSA